MFKKLFKLILHWIQSLQLSFQKTWRQLQSRYGRGRLHTTDSQGHQSTPPPNQNSSQESEEEMQEMRSYCIGDTSCRYNAHSPYIRCAVNPCGPCENCPHYEPKE